MICRARSKGSRDKCIEGLHVITELNQRLAVVNPLEHGYLAYISWRNLTIWQRTNGVTHNVEGRTWLVAPPGQLRASGHVTPA